MTTAPIDLDAVRAALAKMGWMGRPMMVGDDFDGGGLHRLYFGDPDNRLSTVASGAAIEEAEAIAATFNAAPALLARIEALEAGLTEACDVAIEATRIDYGFDYEAGEAVRRRCDRLRALVRPPVGDGR